MGEMFVERADRSVAALSSDPDGDRFRIVFDAVNDGIFITEKATGQVMDVNEAGCRMFGYDKSELIGRSIGPLSSGEYPYTYELATARVARPARQAARTFEWHCKTKAGNLFWSEISVRHTEFENIPVAVSIVRDVSGRKRLNAEIAHMAQHDALTGLANRSVFIATLERAMLHAQRGDKSMAILFVDLDHFKEVNAMRGHLVGDQLVRLVARRLQGAVRFNETAFRLGGDGFAVLLSDAGEPADIAAVADRLISTISKPFMIHGSEVQIGASVGVAIAGVHALDPDTLMSHAGTALHRAKAEGRNTYRFHSAAMDDEVRSRIALTEELRVAIPAGQLFVVYQPQVSTRDGRVVGVEALVRWAHPDRGMLTPASFLDVAESSGLIVDLDRWVLRQACWQARQWIEAGVRPGKMCVNLSGLQFKQPLELEKFVLAALDETGLPAGNLELEITETTFIGFSSEHRTMIHRLRAAGVTFTLDDFGTGHSSLNYLRRFTVDRIKIAREFIADVAVSQDAAAIVKCILTLARELGNGVIAEGVETLEQLKLLQDWNCPDIQGFYFARPMTAEAISPLLSAGTIVPARLH